MNGNERITLLEAAKIGARWMQDWLDQSCCDCEHGHTCGRNEREKELNQILEAIKPPPESNDAGE